jgi:hypothetical protein
MMQYRYSEQRNQDWHFAIPCPAMLGTSEVASG